MIPSLFPIYQVATGTLQDGTEVAATGFCKRGIVHQPECSAHYRSLATKSDGYYQCPFGFTSRSIFLNGERWVFTGVVAYPRFDTKNERQKAKQFPQNKIARKSIEASIAFLKDVDRYRADVIQEEAKVLPQAFHELRKLNGAVIQHAERELKDKGESRSLLSIKSAAELMRNNFDILEALSNIEGMRALPSDSSINVYDLTFKMKRVPQERAAEKGMGISVNGVRAIIQGSQKSFPIVPAVLMENAIKYGSKGHVINANIEVRDAKAVLTVENESAAFIDPLRCFERGERYSSETEGGGFGLYLAREVVLAHKGTIRCEVRGTLVRMTVELPLHTVIPQ